MANANIIAEVIIDFLSLINVICIINDNEKIRNMKPPNK